MLKKFVCVFAIAAMCLGIDVCAKEIKGKITKIDGNKITFVEAKQKDSKDYEASKEVKVCKMEKKNKNEVAGGLKAEPLQNIDGKKGIQAMLVVGDDNKVTEIILGGKKKDN